MSFGSYTTLTGSIRYYPEDTILRQYVVTRPQKAVRCPQYIRCTLHTHTFDHHSRKKESRTMSLRRWSGPEVCSLWRL